jgi:hypothetical protein
MKKQKCLKYNIVNGGVNCVGAKWVQKGAWSLFINKLKP